MGAVFAGDHQCQEYPECSAAEDIQGCSKQCLRGPMEMAGSKPGVSLTFVLIHGSCLYIVSFPCLKIPHLEVGGLLCDPPLSTPPLPAMGLLPG